MPPSVPAAAAPMNYAHMHLLVEAELARVERRESEARRLYERNGYRTVAERPIVKDGWRTDAEAWVLMIRDR